MSPSCTLADPAIELADRRSRFQRTTRNVSREQTNHRHGGVQAEQGGAEKN